MSAAGGEEQDLPEADNTNYYSFCDVIASIIKRGVEKVEITSQKKLKTKEKELQKLKRRVKHLEEVARRLEANQVPPLDLQETSTTEDQEVCRSTVRECYQKGDQSEDADHKTFSYGENQEVDNEDHDENSLPSLQELLELIIPATHITQSEEKDVCRWKWDYQELIKCLEEYGLSIKHVIAKEKKRERRVQLQSMLKKVSDVLSDLRKKVGRSHRESPAAASDEVPTQWLNSQALRHNEDWHTKTKNPKEDVFVAVNNDDFFDSEKYACGGSGRDEDYCRTVKHVRVRNPKKKSLDLGSDETKPWCGRKSNQVGQSPDTGRQSSSFVRYAVKTKRNHHLYNLYKRKLKKLRKKYKRATRELKVVAEAYKEKEEKMKTVETERQTLKEHQLVLKKELISKEARIRELKEKLSTVPSADKLRVRLEAASRVMAKQHRQIAEAQKKREVDLKMMENLKKRLSRAESMNANKETVLETCKTNCHNMEEKLEAEAIESCRLKTEVQHLQDTASSLKSQVAELEEKNSTLQSEKLEREDTVTKLKAAMEAKVSTLNDALLKKTAKSEAVETEMQEKLSSLRAQFVARMQVAANKIQLADDKIKELYRAVELFLRQVHEYNRSHKVTHSSPSPEAVQVACDILQLSPTEAEMILQADYDLV